VCERTFLYAQAIQDWTHYRDFVPHNSWSEDAARHLNGLTAKLREHQQEMKRPLLEPKDLRGAPLDPVDQRIEEYVKRALTRWLPAAYPESGAQTERTRETRSALRLIARLERQRHHDLWLSDLLAYSSSPDYPRAVAALARAVQANDDDETAIAQLNANEA